MKWKPYIALIVLSILVGSQVVYYTFILKPVVNGVITTTHILSSDVVYSAYILLGIIVLAVFLNGVFWKLGLFIFLILTVLGVIDFTEYTFAFGIGDLKFRLLPLALFLLHGLLNPEMLYFLGTRSSLDQEIEHVPHDNSPQPEQIVYFEKKFNSKSTEALQEIIELNELLPEAVIASKNILEKRK
ncbi:MAG: hypothetical protein ACI8ZM_000105 [Crocinitomix sp.]